MTAPETTLEQQISPEELELLQEAIRTGFAQQPTLHLLDVEQAEWFSLDGTLHEISFDSVHGHFDTATARFVPDDPEDLRQLLAQKLLEVHGDAPLDAGGQPVTLSWETVQITGEDNGLIAATATSTTGEQVMLSVDLDWQVTVDPVAPAAQIDGAYLGSYYGDTEFPFDGRTFVIDWATWETDQTTDEGLVGAPVEATGDGARFALYAWFDPAVGIQVVRADPLGDAAAADPDAADAPDHGITATYLGDYYGDAALPFDGRAFVVDWTTWDPDQVTDDGMVGSRATGTDEDGRQHDLYVWFAAATGAQIAEATAAAEDDASAEDDGIGDPQAYFAEVLTEELRQRWKGNGNKLSGSSADYDVSAWVNGDYGGELEYVSHDGTAFHATVTAATIEDEPRQVLCHLRIQDADTLTVESAAP
jgi:hypothetical protein